MKVNLVKENTILPSVCLLPSGFEMHEFSHKDSQIAQKQRVHLLCLLGFFVAPLNERILAVETRKCLANSAAAAFYAARGMPSSFSCASRFLDAMAIRSAN